MVEMAKAMLHEKGLPYYLWAEAVHTAVYILNRCPTRALGDMTPFEAYMGGNRGLHTLKSLVACAMCIYQVRVYDPVTKKLILSRDVVFDEHAAWNWKAMPENHVFVSSHE
ncbi:hypothetical protein L3X38_006630 [Prunus dulcis]|uniref:Retroviral polymerase SH3-like domain-containing protein n=1 Tax=Prunus dulcis TaxID=3755 RepID=A0AAD4ZTC9_PRUDU|nr:hypothetical protein L3X38_006630 [Prunus dulcis]